MRAHDLRSKAEEYVPQPGILIGGFPCQDRCKRNPNSANMVGCVSQGAGRAGEVFEDIAQVVEQTRPNIVILENSTGLLQPNPGTETSDCDYIASRFSVDMGIHAGSRYFSFDRVVEAKDFGSKSARERVYMFKGCFRSEASLLAL
eukprot:1560960-Pyramimonas_sp.AAC.1